MNRTVRALLSAAAATLTATTVLVGLATGPAQAETYGSVPLKGWSYVDKAQPSTPNPDPDGDYLIGSSADPSGLKHTGRAYFTFDLTQLKGQVLHRVTFYTTERTVVDCSRLAPIEVWRTKPVTSTTTWQHTPKELELLGERSYGSGTTICPGAYMGIDMIPAIQAAFARGEKTLTLGVRIKAGSEGDATVGRTMAQARMSFAANHAPKVSGLKLKYPDGGCGTLAKHPTAGSRIQVQATVTDADPNDHPQTRYAYWPVDRPDERRESSSPNLSLSGLADGTVVAWTARGEDYDDAGAWGKTCYFTVDTIAPAVTPIVSSKQYPSNDYPGTGGPGVPGTFVFDAAGDVDVVGFDWGGMDGGLLERVTANHPGGRAKVTITPSRWGSGRLEVAARDAAGNRGPFVEYRYQVRNSAPFVFVDVAGVGLTSRVTLSSRLPETTDLGYAVDGGPEKRLAAVDGKAADDVVFTSVGTKTVVARAYAGSKMIGAETVQVTVSDAPKITSADFDWTKDPVEGVPGSFTFAPRTTGVVSYVYQFAGGDEKTVEADADGRAVLVWTPDRGGSFGITVSSVDESGHRSQPASLSFSVIALRPEVGVYGFEHHVGEPIPVWVWTYLPDAAALVYSLDGGPQQTTGLSNSFEVVAERAGDLVLRVWVKRADGSLSPPAEVVIPVSSAPRVAAKGPFGEAAVLGRPVSLTFTAGVPGTTSFRYSVSGGPEQTVPAGAGGTTTVTYDVPVDAGEIVVRVAGLTADGTASQTNAFLVPSQNPGVEVSSTWAYDPGGPGIPGQFGFSAWDLTDVTTKFLWHVDGDPVQEVEYDWSAWETVASYTPERAGEHTLYVQREFTDGSRSPVTTVPFVVG
ncbi:hypothetical protein [Paractinoplanes lichenicola]|uniref:DNRLRE domain-containing protein n=1 Tax=Paractinoplanes lichenicola TaxID=2802976 RepID=A0ABS1W2W4_9ACTN|nr:hypothetical protein [Actinoplanes lichenicola]MBL7261081.1 hypothetical protein [Actinoplanes lichenicola]